MLLILQSVLQDNSLSNPKWVQKEFHCKRQALLRIPDKLSEDLINYILIDVGPIFDQVNIVMVSFLPLDNPHSWMYKIFIRDISCKKNVGLKIQMWIPHNKARKQLPSKNRETYVVSDLGAHNYTVYEAASSKMTSYFNILWYKLSALQITIKVVSNASMWRTFMMLQRRIPACLLFNGNFLTMKFLPWEPLPS